VHSGAAAARAAVDHFGGRHPFSLFKKIKLIVNLLKWENDKSHQQSTLISDTTSKESRGHYGPATFGSSF